MSADSPSASSTTLPAPPPEPAPPLPPAPPRLPLPPRPLPLLLLLLPSPSWHSTTIIPGPRLAPRRRWAGGVTPRSGRAGEDLFRPHRHPEYAEPVELFALVGGHAEAPRPAALRRPHSTVPPPRSSTNRRAAMPAAARTSDHQEGGEEPGCIERQRSAHRCLGPAARGPQLRPRVLWPRLIPPGPGSASDELGVKLPLRLARRRPRRRAEPGPPGSTPCRRPRTGTRR